MKLNLRIDLGGHGAVGPGKARLLELIAEHGSISAAGRAMGMSYRRAWLLVDSLNQAFREPVVTTQIGGTSGGGAALTEAGQTLLAHYRAIETEAQAAVAGRLTALQSMLSDRPPGHPAPDDEDYR